MYHRLALISAIARSVAEIEAAEQALEARVGAKRSNSGVYLDKR